MRAMFVVLGFLFSSAASFAAQECFSWTDQPPNAVAELVCDISPWQGDARFTLSSLKSGVCEVRDLKSIAEFSRIRTTGSMGRQHLTVHNEKGYELFELDISSLVKTGDEFYFRLSFPQPNAASKTAIVTCKAKAPTKTAR